MNILDEIFSHKQVEVSERKQQIPLAEIRCALEKMPRPLDFVTALREAACKPALIAEVKHASPSRGLLVRDFDPLRLACTYAKNGAAAISVLTDERYFQGSLNDLQLVAGMTPRLPVLRKDFFCDAYQVYEARAAGADAVLLIAAYLESGLLRDLHALTADLGMAALVEIHNREELESVFNACAPSLLGINNRDLRNFSVRLETSLELRRYVPENICLVAESGIHTREDAVRLGQAGIHAILVGEALVTAPDAGAKVRSLAGVL